MLGLHSNNVKTRISEQHSIYIYISQPLYITYITVYRNSYTNYTEYIYIYVSTTFRKKNRIQNNDLLEQRPISICYVIFSLLPNHWNKFSIILRIVFREHPLWKKILFLNEFPFVTIK